MKTIKRIISATLVVCVLVLTLSFIPQSASAATLVTGNITEGVYYIQHVGSKKYLDITDESTANGAQLQIWQKASNHQNQVFQLAKVGNYWKIIPCHSRKAIEVRDSSMQNGAKVAQWDYKGIPCQQWSITKNSDGSFSLRNRNSGKYLDVTGNGSENGTKLIQYTKNGTSAQKFKFYKLNTKDVLNAKWSRSFKTSDVFWTSYSINSNRINKTRFSHPSSVFICPTPGKKYLTKVEYIDRKSVYDAISNKSLNQSTHQQILNAIAGEGIESAAGTILKKLGFNHVPFLGIAVGLCEILSTAESNNDWNNFVRAVTYDQYGNSGVIKKTYVTIVERPVWGPLYGSTAYGWTYYIQEHKTYTYSSWNGNGGISEQDYSGSWSFNFK